MLSESDWESESAFSPSENCFARSTSRSFAQLPTEKHDCAVLQTLSASGPSDNRI